MLVGREGGRQGNYYFRPMFIGQSDGSSRTDESQERLSQAFDMDEFPPLPKKREAWYDEKRDIFPEITARFHEKRQTLNEALEEKKKGIKGRTQHEYEGVEWHTLEPANLLIRLNTNMDEGLAEVEASQCVLCQLNQLLTLVARRLALNGQNLLKPKQQNKLWVCIKYLFSGFGLLLWPASLMCFLAWKPLGDPHPGMFFCLFCALSLFLTFYIVPFLLDSNNLLLAIILQAIIWLNIIFSVVQDWTSGRVMKGISKMMPQEARVLRGGCVKVIPAAQLVAGDVVELTLGCRVPADLRLLVVDQLSLDCSMITGESDPVHCVLQEPSDSFLHAKNIAFMGTSCVEGRGTGVVVATGANTLLGSITNTVSSSSSATTPLIRDIRIYIAFVVRFFCLF